MLTAYSVNWKIAINKIFFSNFYLRWVTVTTFTETAISPLEIIVQKRLHALPTCLGTLRKTRYLRNLVDRVARVYLSRNLLCVLYFGLPKR